MIKSSLVILALLLALAGYSQAQLIEAQNFGGNGIANFNLTLTQTGPINVIVTSTSGMSISIDGHATSQTALDNADFTSGNLAPGVHSVSVMSTFITSTGGATVIVPNEPPAGVQSAIDNLNGQITTLQQAEQTDASNIAALQTAQGNQATQISALQAAEANDASLISGLQSQLQTIETTLQNEITQDEANIAALQSGQTGQTGQITTLQQEVGQLQTQVEALQNTLASIQSTPTDSSATSQYTALQNQISSLKGTQNDQWIALGAVGLLGATGTAISAYELSQGGNNPATSSASSGARTGSYNPYGSNTGSYSKKN